jgi:seryl-tRNA synthetase
MAHARSASRGLATLGPDEVAIRDALEERILGWAAECGAEPAIYPSLIPVEGLDRLDYFRNFPHLGVMTAGIAEHALETGIDEAGTVETIAPEQLEPARYALPSAACFNVYLSMAGERIDGARRITTGANCFRREDHYDDTRLLGFYMREIVCVGVRGAVLDHLATFKPRVLAFAEELGLPLRAEPSSDPFFDSSGARALMAQLFPVKEELVHDGESGEVAIASLNFHRNFFGERCGITLADGSPAFSGCVAFGIERWITVLQVHLGEPASEICRRIRAATV